MLREPWSDGELELLKKLRQARHSAPEITERINAKFHTKRSISAIHNKLHAVARDEPLPGETIVSDPPPVAYVPMAPVQPVPTSAHLPMPAPEAGGPSLPPSVAKPLIPVQVDTPGHWLVLGDVHLPMHDCPTVEAAVREAKQRNIAGILLNGDIMDMFGISPFFRLPTRERFVDEIEAARAFLLWLRGQFPNARIVYREGNHEFRLTRYIADRAAALFELEEVHLPALLRMDKLGIEWVNEKRKVMLGKLATLHGHELRKGEGVNPARLAFLRTTCSVIIGHFHRTSEHHQRALDDHHFAVWSHGCACYMSPDYDPYTQWNHGFAFVEVANDGWFSVQNKRVLHGRIV